MTALHSTTDTWGVCEVCHQTFMFSMELGHLLGVKPRLCDDCEVVE
jgi:hypothetical protein